MRFAQRLGNFFKKVSRNVEHRQVFGRVKEILRKLFELGVAHVQFLKQVFNLQIQPLKSTED